MLMCMRTSMNLPDGLLEAAKERARQEGRTVTSLVEEALRNLLEDKKVRRKTRALPTDGNPGGRILIDLSDRDQLWAELGRK